MAKKNYHPVSAEVENNPLYHDTYKLLRCYRDSTYSLMVAVRQVEIQFQLEYNTSVDEFLDSIYAAGADLGDSQIEEWAKITNMEKNITGFYIMPFSLHMN